MLIGVLIAVIISQGIMTMVVARSNSRLKSELTVLKAQIFSFLAPEKPGELSPLAQAFDLFGDSLAHKIGTVTQASIRGTLGASSRAITGTLEAEAEEVNPILAFLPKSLTKNPKAMIGLQALMSRIGTGGAGPGPGSNGSQVKFNL